MHGEQILKAARRAVGSPRLPDKTPDPRELRVALQAMAEEEARDHVEACTGRAFQANGWRDSHDRLCQAAHTLLAHTLNLSRPRRLKHAQEILEIHLRLTAQLG